MFTRSPARQAAASVKVVWNSHGKHTVVEFVAECHICFYIFIYFLFFARALYCFILLHTALYD